MAQTVKLKRSATEGAAPSTSDLALGEVAINTYDGKVYIKKNDGSDSIVEVGGAASGAYTKYAYTATSSQTTFSVSYAVGFVDVWLNGVKLDTSDFTATNTTSIVLASAATSGDLFEAIAWNIADIQQNAYTKYSYTATSGQTTFTATYTQGYVNVYLNGILLIDSTEYTATNGTSIVLASGATTGDSVVIEAFTTFSAADPQLVDIAGLTPSDGGFIVGDGSNFVLESGATAIASLGITSTAAELNLLDGVTATTAEINYLDGVTSNIQTQFDSISGTPLVQSFTANGAIASGKPVILETAGTVAEVAETAISPDAPIGSTTLVDGNNTEYINFAADPHNENRWVAVYADDIGNKDAFMKVFTRSGTTITQSSAISLLTGGTSNREINVCFDKAQANVVLLMYNNNSNDGAVRVATISGSAGSESVSLGSETSFYTSQPIFTSSGRGAISLINLDTSGTFLGMWTDANAANNTLKGRVFQVSGTSVTAGGSTTNLATDSSGYGDDTHAIREHYSDTTKAYLAYRDTGAALAMKVLTVSGTSISVGTKYGSSTDVAGGGVSISPISSSKIIVSSVKNSGNYPSYHVVTDSSGTLSYGTYTTISSVSAQTVVGLNNTNNNALVFPVYYAYNGGSGVRPFVKILTSNSDGSTISLSSEDEIDTSNTIAASWSNVALQEDEAGHYMWIGEISSDLYFILGKAGGSSTNLTSTNYIGVAEAAISDTASGNIMLRGGVSEKVSSLTAGSTYYVQTDGTFATSAGSPSVEAGKALSATKLLLKGL